LALKYVTYAGLIDRSFVGGSSEVMQGRWAVGLIDQAEPQ
jgi:hypothetical protein